MHSYSNSGSMALQANDLVKTYATGRGKPSVRALQGLSFSAQTGTVFGLLGPNGAGKSTTVKILSTLARADSGTAIVAGFDVTTQPDRVRKAIGFVAQKPVSDPIDTGRENLVLAGQLHGMQRRDAASRADELLARFGLTDAANRQVGKYSGGMARKLDVAIGLMHRPQVLFLDEPTTGLDPEARADMWAEIARMAKQEHMTILLTTHYLDEADKLADRLAIVDHGRIIVSGTPEELKSDLQGDAVQLELEDPSHARTVLARIGIVRDMTIEAHLLRARVDSGAQALPVVLTALEEAGIRAHSAAISRPSLDDVYLRYAGRSFGMENGSTDSKETFERSNA